MAAFWFSVNTVGEVSHLNPRIKYLEPDAEIEFTF